MTYYKKLIILPILHGLILGAIIIYPICLYFNWPIFGWRWWVLAIAGNLPVPYLYKLNKPKEQ